ncbi:MAG: hypothetical protein ACOZCO_09265 [Bacteroidota bacterium]
MKKTIITLTALFTAGLSYSQLSLEGFYQFGMPSGPMTITFDNSHGLGLSVMGKQTKESRFSYGLTGVYSFYGHENTTVESMASDSTIVSNNVQVSNYFTTLSLTGRYTFPQFAGRITPFINGNVGWAHFVTDMYIGETIDYDNCAPVQPDILQTDNTWLLNGSAGIELYMNGLFNPENADKEFQSIVNFSVGYTYGGRVSYMNADKNDLTIAGGGHSGHTETSGSEVNPYYVPFINTQTQVVHEHYIGSVYTSPFRMLEFRLGFVFRF